MGPAHAVPPGMGESGGPGKYEPRLEQDACTDDDGLSLRWRMWPVGGDEQMENLTGFVS